MTKASERTKKWQKRNPERYRLNISRTNARRRADGSYRRWYLLNKYGITPEQWTALFESQNKSYAICKTRETKNWVTDHNHVTGKVRGILCDICNRIVLPVVEHYQMLVLPASQYLVNS